jgi:hypothetical protein
MSCLVSGANPFSIVVTLNTVSADAPPGGTFTQPPLPRLRRPSINIFSDLIAPEKYIGRLKRPLALFVPSQPHAHARAIAGHPVAIAAPVAVRDGACGGLGTIPMSTTPIPEDTDA